MADPKDSDGNSGAPTRRPQAEAPGATRGAARRDDASPAGAADPPPAPAAADATAAAVTTRETQYLIAPRVLAGGMQPFALEPLETHLNGIEGITVVRRIVPGGGGAAPQALGGAAQPGTVLVARTTPERGQELEAASRQGAPVIVERDMLLNHHGLAPLEATGGLGAGLAAGAIPTPAAAAPLTMIFRVTGADQQPLDRCQVTVFGKNFPGQAVTDAAGQATVTVFGETPNSIAALYVKPFADHWERYIERPQLSVDGTPNLIVLQPLSSLLPRFPQQQMLGWGQELMGLGQVPADLDGRNVKVAIIDSGCDNTHPQLQHITEGVDLTDPAKPGGWTLDEISHGTHCAGMIAGKPAGQRGIRGFAPGAEVLVLKVFPGGRFSNLIDALDLCIQRQVDVVNCSLGSGQVSEIVQRKLEEARQNGIACIVAAGNSAGPVQFPATMPGVLSVSALGQEKRFPADSFHAQSLMPNTIGVNGVYPAKFSCFGPEVKVAGPGVAIVSTVPGGGYAAWDGTSMAAPHLTGLAALVLAHHPLFQGQLRTRSAQRVDALFQVILAAASPLISDPLRGGRGLPNLPTALGAGQAMPAPAMSLAQALGGLVGVPIGTLLAQAALGSLGGFGAGGPAAPPPGAASGAYPGAYPGAPPPAGQDIPSMPWGAISMPQVLQQLRSLGLL